MSRSLAAAGFYVRDRLGRAALLLAAALAVLVPRALALGRAGPGARGFRDGLAAGGADGTLAGLYGLLLVAGVLVLWQGVVSADVESGRFRTLLARPLWPPGLYLARHGAALALVAGTAGATAAVLRCVAGAGGGDPAGVVLSALLTGWALGGVVLLLSSLLRRGDVLSAAALFLAPGAIDPLAEVGPTSAAAAEALSLILPPMASLRDARHALVAGAAPDPEVLAAPVAYGAAVVALALLRLHTREYRAG